MKLRLLMVIALCALVVELQGAVYVQSGSRYPFPRPDRPAPNVTTLTSNRSAGVKRPSSIYSSMNRRYQRDILNLDVIGITVDQTVPKSTDSASLTEMPQRSFSQPTPTMTTDNQQNADAFLITEDQRPIDFDLNLRPSVQFVPGLKSVIDLPPRNATDA